MHHSVRPSSSQPVASWEGLDGQLQRRADDAFQLPMNTWTLSTSSVLDPIPQPLTLAATIRSTKRRKSTAIAHSPYSPYRTKSTTLASEASASLGKQSSRKKEAQGVRDLILDIYLGGENNSCHLLRDAWESAFTGVRLLTMIGAPWDQSIICFCIRAVRRKGCTTGTIRIREGCPFWAMYCRYDICAYSRIGQKLLSV